MTNVSFLRVRVGAFTFAAVAMLTGCSRSSGGNAADATPALAASSVPAPTETMSASIATSASALPTARAALAPSAMAARVDAKPPIEGDIDNPVVRRRTDRGVLVVWREQEDEGTSEVLAAFEKKPGELAGPAKIIRRTSGNVLALDTITNVPPFGEMTVAWASDLGEAKGQLVAIANVTKDLSRVASPLTIGIVAGQITLQGHVALARNPHGGVVVAHQGPDGRCPFADGFTDCPTFEVHAVSPSGAVTSLAKAPILGGPSPEFVLVNADDRALFVYGSSMRGGRTIVSLVVPYPANGEEDAIDGGVTMTPPMCQGLAAYMPEVLRGSEGEYVAFCMDVRDPKVVCARPVRGDPARCLRVAVTDAFGAPVTPRNGDARATRVECGDGGAPRISFQNGAVTVGAPSLALADFAPLSCRNAPPQSP